MKASPAVDLSLINASLVLHLEKEINAGVAFQDNTIGMFEEETRYFAIV